MFAFIFLFSCFLHGCFFFLSCSRIWFIWTFSSCLSSEMTAAAAVAGPGGGEGIAKSCWKSRVLPGSPTSATLPTSLISGIWFFQIKSGKQTWRLLYKIMSYYYMNELMKEATSLSQYSPAARTALIVPLFMLLSDFNTIWKPWTTLLVFPLKRRHSLGYQEHRVFPFWGLIRTTKQFEQV